MDTNCPLYMKPRSLVHEKYVRKNQNLMLLNFIFVVIHLVKNR